MTQILKRALPFILAFVFGVAITAIIGRISPVRQKGSFDCGRTKWKSQTVDVWEWTSQAVDVWELRDPATQIRFPITVRKSRSSMLTLKEQALLVRASQDVARNGPAFVVNYASPDVIDGRPYTSNVMISNIARPAFWDTEEVNKRTQACNTLVRVELHASGIVSRAEPVPGYGDQCAPLSDILDAAKQISFSPALRDGVPVTLRMSLMYRAR
jgi:hypothetical protein